MMPLLRNGEVVTLTDSGTEIGMLVPPNFKQAMARRKLAKLAETAVIGDIVSPINIKWNADSENL